MRLAVIAMLIACALSPVRAQVVTETPVPFDSTGRLNVLNPGLAERLRLAPPDWPVQGDFRDARLYSVGGSSGFVLSVLRADGRVDRYALSPAERQSLSRRIDASMIVAGRPSGEQGSEVMSEPAGNAFARRQTLLAAAVYGPLAASLSDHPSAGGALYLATTGAAFFASYSAAQNGDITRAQSHLASHHGLAAGGAAMLYGYAGTNNWDKPVRALGLGAAIVGTVAGVQLGRGLSDAEAHSATGGVESMGIASLGLMGTIGASDRAKAAGAATGLLLGYPIGLAYPRSTSYTVTAGDVDAVGTSGLIGAAVGGAILGDRNDEKTGFALLSGSYLTGLFVGDRIIARRYDLTQSESNFASFGAFAGGLLGAAVPVLADAGNTSAVLGAAALGATIGFGAVLAGSKHFIGPGTPHKSRNMRYRNSKLEFNLNTPAILVAAGRTPGVHPIVGIRF